MSPTPQAKAVEAIDSDIKVAEKHLREAIKYSRTFFNYTDTPAAVITVLAQVSTLSSQLVEREQEVARLRDMLTQIADGRVGPEKAAHYNAHRKCVASAPPTLRGWGGARPMACSICNRAEVYHGSEDGRPGSHLSEAGCQSGVLMDDDEYAEGWAKDTVYTPCPFSPHRCPACDGTGQAPPEHLDSDDCPACGGNGWKNGEDQVPDDRYERMDVDAGQDLRSVRDWLHSLSSLDMAEIAADGGITVAMVVQGEAREMAARMDRALTTQGKP